MCDSVYMYVCVHIHILCMLGRHDQKKEKRGPDKKRRLEKEARSSAMTIKVPRFAKYSHWRCLRCTEEDFILGFRRRFILGFMEILSCALNPTRQTRLKPCQFQIRARLTILRAVPLFDG